MSDLKHRTPEQLRSLIKWCEQKQAEHRADWAAKEDMVAALQAEIDEHRRTYHNIGQKAAWARIWLARKELGMVEP